LKIGKQQKRLRAFVFTEPREATQMENCKACGNPLEDWEELSTTCEGCEQMAQTKQLPGDLWTTLISAADRAAFPIVVLGCGSRAALRADVAAWVAGARGHE
jgi:hypothetical protein